MTDETSTVPAKENEGTTSPTDTTVAETPKTAPAEKAEDGGPKKIERNRPRRRRDNRGPRREAKEFEESILNISRVTRVVKGGRRMRFKVSVVIGDKKGRVGFGSGKSTEVIGSIQKAVAQAKKKLVRIPLHEGSIPHETLAKFKASKVLLFPAPEGKGVIAGGAVRKILELAGVKNVLSKAHGSRNALNLAQATFKALGELKSVAVKKESKESGEVKKEEPKEEEKKPAEKKPVEKAAKKAPEKKPAKKPAAKK